MRLEVLGAIGRCASHKPNHRYRRLLRAPQAATPPPHRKAQ